MSATVISDPMVLSAPETQPPPAAAAAAKSAEVEAATCECCGLTEECTPGYIQRITERYNGKWLCGLCAEAVKDETIRATADQRLICTEEAMARHMNFCKKFLSAGPPPDPTVHLISVMRQILRRSLDSSPRSTPTSSTDNNVRIGRNSVLARSETCFPTLSG